MNFNFPKTLFGICKIIIYTLIVVCARVSPFLWRGFRIIIFFFPFFASAQFAPPAGQAGSTAVYKDSSIFVAWATGCTVTRGYQDISNTALGYASAGEDSFALGKADGATVSLGDGGFAIVTFAKPVKNGDGSDFAVFENAFDDNFLELAFVEVSSDGLNFYRFPAASYTQDTMQTGTFGNTDAAKINNLAGKYRASFGTPFDLQELAGQNGLDINNITHIRITDVVGCIQNAYARYDQYGNIINDPWNTPFPSGGFDLDAVGVIHSAAIGIDEAEKQVQFSIFPNPVKNVVGIRFCFDDIKQAKIIFTDIEGNVQMLEYADVQKNKMAQLNTSRLASGFYLITVLTQKGMVTKKICINSY